jgi:hypothetical protein
MDIQAAAKAKVGNVKILSKQKRLKYIQILQFG